MQENNFTTETLQHYIFRTEKPDYTVPPREASPESDQDKERETAAITILPAPSDRQPGPRPKPPINHGAKNEETIRKNQLIEEIKNLTPKAIEALEEMICSSRIQAMARVKAIELALSYAIGKPETTFKLESAGGERVIEASERIERIVRNIRISPPGEPQEGSSDHAG